jgi:hypothetical protein
LRLKPRPLRTRRTGRSRRPAAADFTWISRSPSRMVTIS